MGARHAPTLPHAAPTELLLVSDNDFGVTGATTQFWRVRLATPLDARA